MTKYTKSDIYTASVLTPLTRTPIIIFFFFRKNAFAPFLQFDAFFRADIVPGFLTEYLIEKVRYFFRSPSGDSKKKHHREAFFVLGKC